MSKNKNTFIVITGVIIGLIGLFLFPLFAQGVSITLDDGTALNLPDIEFEPSQWVEKEIEKKDFLHYTLDITFLSPEQQKEIIKCIKERTDHIYLTGQYSRLIEEMNILKALALSQGEDDLLAESLYYQGRAWYRQGKDDEALQVLLQALEKYKALQDNQGIMRAYITLAGIYQSFQDLNKSEEYVQKALSLAEQLQDISGKASTSLSFGIISFYRGDLEKAEKYFLDSCNLAAQAENVEIIALSLNNLAYVYVERGDYQKAQQVCESS
ncbi:unnamed protein product, partial [marine sediment metagenome]